MVFHWQKQAEKKQEKFDPKKKKIIKIAIITFVVIILSVGSFVGYNIRLQALPTVNAINSIGEITLNSKPSIEQAELLYNSLPLYTKYFVTNSRNLTKAKNTFDALPIPITSSNYAEYLSFDVSFSNFKGNKTYLGYGYYAYDGTADMKITFNPIKKMRFNNVVINAKFAVNNGTGILGKGEWKTETVTFNLSEDGYATTTNQISYSSLILSANQPSFDGTKEFISISGTVSKN